MCGVSCEAKGYCVSTEFMGNRVQHDEGGAGPPCCQESACMQVQAKDRQPVDLLPGIIFSVKIMRSDPALLEKWYL